MRRSALRRSIERLALVSLPWWAAAGCGTPRSLQPPDLAPAPEDMARDCPVYADPCYWLALVDGSAPNDKVFYWLGDGGVDPCLPCKFESTPGAFCGACQIIENGCGTGYLCDINDCSSSCDSSGRRPPGLSPLPSRIAVGAERLARMAHLEAASVPAFTQLARELAAHGAPERLIAGARRARADEERHAAMVGKLAKNAGARLLALDVRPTPPRPLVELALENAVEGCVRETLGAAVAAEEARRVADPSTARVLREIAVDERRHANLAWAVDEWALPLLTMAERRRVEVARTAAVRELSTPS